MKKILFILISTLLFPDALAQYTLSGTVISQETQSPAIGTAINISHSGMSTISKNDGSFLFGELPQGIYIITFRNISFREKKITVDLRSDTVLAIVMESAVILADEVMIAATRAGEKTPVTFSEMDKKDISRVNYGKDMPFILNQLPSVVITSDAGNGIGYTGIRIRGTDASRINVTVNGIPLNDAESHNVYWVDLPDLASSIENIQIQRGLGTSTNGAGAFGGSINVQTNKINTVSFIESAATAGSFNTLKNNIAIGSGLINNHWFMESRLSKITSDGYIDRAFSDLKSFFLSGGYAGQKTIARLNIILGKEVTYQSWNGVPESRLKNDTAGMIAYIYNNYLSSKDSLNLIASGRTYNYHTYANQVDNYQQDHYQLLLSHQFTPKLLLNTAFHYTKGMGYYEEFVNDTIVNYGLDQVVIGQDTVVTSDLVRRKWLANDFYGFTWSVDYATGRNSKLIAGGALNQYDGDHFNELTWMQYPSNSWINQRYYFDNALKTDFNVFVKYTHDLTETVSIYIDQQFRNVHYRFTTFDAEYVLRPQEDELNFYNPKGGLYIKLNASHAAFASVCMGHKEPNRDDFTSTRFSERPQPEQMTDYEAGYNYHDKHVAAGVNFYFMAYKDQLVLRGDVNEVGNYNRINVPKSYRLGMEITSEFKVFKWLGISGNLTISRNKIKSFTDRLNNFDSGETAPFKYENTDIAFSPPVTGLIKIDVSPVKNLSVQLSAKYIGKQYLDNTQNESRIINSYTVSDAIVSYKIHLKQIKEITFGLMLNNILDEMYVSNGYTYGYISGGKEIHDNLYYPQAGFNFLGQLSVKL